MNNNRITQQQAEDLVDLAEFEEKVFWGKVLVRVYRLPCGFTVLGQGACVDPENFHHEVGRAVAREDAISQVWKLEGYRLQLEFAAKSDDNITPAN